MTDFLVEESLLTATKSACHAGKASFAALPIPHFAGQIGSGKITAPQCQMGPVVSQIHLRLVL